MQLPTCEAKNSCCKERAWPHQLHRVLQGEFGQYGSPVTVQNECIAAVGTDVFVLKFMTNQTFRKALEAADAIIVEMATNDYPHSKADRIMHTELFVNLLQSLPNEPFIMWLSAAWANRKVVPWSHVNLNSDSNAEVEHLLVMRHYGIAHTSMLSLFRLSTQNLFVAGNHSEGLFEFLENVYFQDSLHPGYLAQRMIAAVVARRLIQLLKPPTNQAAANWFGFADAQAGHPGFISERAAMKLSRYKSESNVKVDSLNLEQNCSEVALLEGFALELEGTRKWGYIGHQVGDAMVLRLPVNTFRVAIGAMHSYEHNGIMRVRIVESSDLDCESSTTSLTEEQCSSCIVLGETLHDTRWSEKASIRHELEIQLSRSSRGRCQWLHVSVADAPGRSENKVKLLGVSAFQKSSMPR